MLQTSDKYTRMNQTTTPRERDGPTTNTIHQRRTPTGKEREFNMKWRHARKSTSFETNECQHDCRHKLTVPRDSDCSWLCSVGCFFHKSASFELNEPTPCQVMRTVTLQKENHGGGQQLTACRKKKKSEDCILHLLKVKRKRLIWSSEAPLRMNIVAATISTRRSYKLHCISENNILCDKGKLQRLTGSACQRHLPTIAKQLPVQSILFKSLDVEKRENDFETISVGKVRHV